MNKKVFVSGCYDMLHSGHIAFFQAASKYGDVYVGIGSDANILKLKGRKPIISQNERLYSVKSIKYVKDAFINDGFGLIDFENIVDKIQPDYFFVNEDGYSVDKENFCKKHNLKLIVEKRIPFSNFEFRSTTNLRKLNNIPYRIELCGGWLDQPMINSKCSGSVIVASVLPTIDFNHRSGMATSSRNKAIELWQNRIPCGDPEMNAKILFSYENPPGTKHVSGSQDQLGILLPGINKLKYDNGYWPAEIDSLNDDEHILFIEKHIHLMQLNQRNARYDVFDNMNLDISLCNDLAESSKNAWEAILNMDAKALGRTLTSCMLTQMKLFPNMYADIKQHIDVVLKDSAVYGCKISGAGGGGYLMIVSDVVPKNSIQITVRRSDYV